MATEEPKYTVIKSEEDFEIRRYEPFIVAETWCRIADLESGSDKGSEDLLDISLGAIA